MTLREALIELNKASIRFTILECRFRGCHETTGNHEVSVDDAHDFANIYEEVAEVIENALSLINMRI